MTRADDPPNGLLPPDAARSRNMSAIKRTNTKPELALRSALHRAGLRFRKDMRLDLGTTKPRPDVVFTRAKVAVFVDGCFWHCCPNHGVQPARNSEFWAQKLARNVRRDREQDAALSEHGWLVVRIWEHEAIEDAAKRVAKAVASSTPK